MTLPTQGEMSAAMINTELGREVWAPFNINGTQERALAGKPSGAISLSDFYGKSSFNSIRSPATGDYFIHPANAKKTVWAQRNGGSDHYIIWFGEVINVPNMQILTEFEHGGWKYHRAAYKEYGSYFGNSVYHWLYGVWRESLPSQTGDIIEPQNGDVFDNNFMWRDRGGTSDQDLKWGLVTAFQSGGWDYIIKDGWRYERGDFRQSITSNGIYYHQFGIYRKWVG